MMLTVLGLAWLTGLALGAWVAQPLWMWLAAGGALAVAGGAVRWLGRWPRAPLMLGVLSALALGAARYEAARPVVDAGAVAYYNDAGPVTLEGWVWDEPDPRDTRTNLRVAVTALTPAGAQAPRPVSGLVLVYAPRFSEARLTAAGVAEWRYGDQVRVTGSLETPPEFEAFSYREYLARQGIHAQVRLAEVTLLAERQGNPFFQALFDFKAHALSVVAGQFPEPHAALLQGILLGAEAGIPADIKQQFSLTGTSHIVAISGFNIAILVGIFMTLFSRLAGPVRGAGLTILVIAAYTLLVGAGASVVRAAVMGSLGVIAQRLGRGGAGLNTLTLAAVAMTLANPHTLWDVGFQLSAAATLGLIIYGDRLQGGLEAALARRLPAERAAQAAGLAGELFLLTLAAQITTVPIIAYTFQQISVISLVANILILPPQPAVMILGGLALIGGLLWAPLGQLLAWLTYPFTAYTLALVDLFARVPGGAIGLGEVAAAVVVAYYAALAVWTWMRRKPAEQRPAWWTRVERETLPTAGVTGLGLAAFLAWGTLFSLPEPGRLAVTVLDVGAGDGVLIQTPSGRFGLIDGGPSGRGLRRSLARELPLFEERLAFLIVTGSDDPQIGGLPDLLANSVVEQVVLPVAGGRGGTWRAVVEEVEKQRIGELGGHRLGGVVLGLGAGAEVRVEEGEKGSAVRVRWGDFAVLVLTREVPEGVLAPATVLVVTAETLRAVDEALIAAVDPRLVIVSGAATARLTPGQAAVLGGRLVLHTATHGAVRLSTDGERLWVAVGR